MTRKQEAERMAAVMASMPERRELTEEGRERAKLYHALYVHHHYGRGPALGIAGMIRLTAQPHKGVW